MSYTTRRSESSASRRSLDEDTTEDGGDDRDETKRKSRNLSEKKRRDQFNILISELSSMVSTSSRKMDKSTVLKATIAFLKVHNELSVQSQVQETQEDWKPSFLSNEEFTHLMLEALDGFIVVISNTGKMLYLSESITSLLGHLPSDLVNCSVYNFIPTEEKSVLFNVLSGAAEDMKCKGCVSVVVNFRLGGLEMKEENEKYQLVKFVGYYNRWISPSDCGSETTEKSETEYSESNDSSSCANILIATGRLMDSDLLREMSVVVDSAKSEFSSRHSLEWKFLFLDHRAPPIIGYLPFEVLGTSGYDYYHVDDLEKVANCHEALMQKGEGTSCFYRFLTKGQQWIWLQTRYYITYHQWNSKPEFIVCTHRVVSYADVMKEVRGDSVQDPEEGSGPSGRKYSKSEHRKSHCFNFKNSSKGRNGGLSYGSITSKRNSFLRKLDLPPKFINTLSSSHSLLTQPSEEESDEPQTETIPDPPPVSSCAGVAICPQPFSNTVTVALHPHLPQFVPTSHQLTPVVQPTVGATMALPLATFQLKPLPPSPAFSIAGTPVRSLLPSQCILQEQLMYKHAELQRQIIQQQEELRRVSEQLLMAQCGILQGEAPILIPQPTLANEGQQVAIGDTQQQYSHQSPAEPSPLIQLQQSYANVLQYQPSIVNYSDQHQQQSIVHLQHPGISDGHIM